MPAIREFRSGWAVLVGGTLGNFAGIGGMLYFALSSFMLPFQRQFGWTRAQVGLAVSCFTLASIIAAPIIGRACDRVGPRRVILASIPVAAATLSCMAWLHGQIWELYIGYFAATLLGAGTLGVTYVNLVAGWFDRRRGLAIGIMLAGGGLSAFTLPLLLNKIIAGFGWRAAWLVLAFVMLAQYPIAFYCVREAPRQQLLRSQMRHRRVRLFREVVLSASFWKMSVPMFLTASTLGGLNVNLVALLVDRRIELGSAAKVAALLGIGIVVARLLVGFLLDRYVAHIVATIVFVSAAGGCAALLSATLSLNAVGAFLLGFTSGAEFDLLGFMTSRYFSRSVQGSAFGACLSVFYFGAMISPVVIGGLYGIYGNYNAALFLGIVLCLIAAGIVASIGNYPVQQEPEPAIGAILHDDH